MLLKWPYYASQSIDFLIKIFTALFTELEKNNTKTCVETQKPQLRLKEEPGRNRRY